MDQKRVVNILLNDEGAVCFVGPLNDVLDFSHILHYLNALSAIRILAGFDYPCVLGCSVFAPDGLNLLLLVRLVVALVVHSLLGLCLLLVVLFDSLLRHLVAPLDLVLQVVVVAHEPAVLLVVDALRRVESQRQHLERVLAEHFVVLSHVDEDSLLVCQLLVILHPIIELEGHHNPLSLCLRLLRNVLLRAFDGVPWKADRILPRRIGGTVRVLVTRELAFFFLLLRGLPRSPFVPLLLREVLVLVDR